MLVCVGVRLVRPHHPPPRQRQRPRPRPRAVRGPSSTQALACFLEPLRLARGKARLSLLLSQRPRYHSYWAAVRSAEDHGWPECVETWKLSVICCRLRGHIQERWVFSRAWPWCISMKNGVVERHRRRYTIPSSLQRLRQSKSYTILQYAPNNRAVTTQPYGCW